VYKVCQQHENLDVKFVFFEVLYSLISNFCFESTYFKADIEDDCKTSDYFVVKILNHLHNLNLCIQTDVNLFIGSKHVSNVFSAFIQRNVNSAPLILCKSWTVIIYAILHWRETRKSNFRWKMGVIFREALMQSYLQFTSKNLIKNFYLQKNRLSANFEKIFLKMFLIYSFVPCKMYDNLIDSL
jgi:hypothetical protein